jgi:hypothetical protein
MKSATEEAHTGIMILQLKSCTRQSGESYSELEAITSLDCADALVENQMQEFRNFSP